MRCLLRLANALFFRSLLSVNLSLPASASGKKKAAVAKENSSNGNSSNNSGSRTQLTPDRIHMPHVTAEEFEAIPKSATHSTEREALNE